MWKAVVGKFRGRVGGWHWREVGLHFATSAYNTDALPVLSSLVRASAPTADALATESWDLRRAAPGLGNWAVPED
eukprot:2792981-Pyramimonas_sp.AAC.1